MHSRRIWKVRNAYKMLVGNLERKRPFGNPGLNGRALLKWVWGKCDLRMWIGFVCLRAGRHLWTL
jgi:hypothetical protein